MWIVFYIKSVESLNVNAYSSFFIEYEKYVFEEGIVA